MKASPEAVAAVQDALGCERRSGSGLEWCGYHDGEHRRQVRWTDRGCPVAVAAADAALEGDGGMKPYVVTIPAPAAWIRSNQHRDAYWTRAKLTQQWRAAAVIAAKNPPALGAGPFHITATIHRDDKRAFDLDGICPTVKAAIDGLRDAGVIDDDNCRVVPALTLRAGEQWADASLVLTIREAS